MTGNASKGKRLPKVKTKLFASFLLFAGIFILLLWLCQVVFLDNIYSYFKTKEIERSASELEHSLSGKNPEKNELDALTMKVAKKNDVCILVFRMLEDGRHAFRLSSADVLSNCAIHTMNDSSVFSLYRDTLESGGKSLKFFSFDSMKNRFNVIDSAVLYGGNDEVYLINSFITRDAGGNTVFVLLNSIVSPLGSTVRTLNVILLSVSALMILLALLLAFVLSKQISSPIIKLNESAKELAKGNYNADFTQSGAREISELGGTLGYAASELSKVDSLRKELIANVSHDLRTPLTLIAGYGEVMRDIPGENTPENVQVIIDEAGRLSSLVNAMLDISKLESGSYEPSFENIDLTSLLEESVVRYRKLTEMDGFTIDFDAKGYRIFVLTDKTLFEQALFNLVGNALTHTGEDKRITVSQEVLFENGTPKTARVTVSDSGEGIPESDLPYIWDRYYKVDKTHKRAEVGTGLGLSIVKKVMKMLDGGCGVESAPGKGSSFYLDLKIEQ